LKFPWAVDLINVESDTGLTIGDLVQAVLKARGKVWYKHCHDGGAKFHDEWTTLQEVISKFTEFLHAPSDSTTPCMDLEFTPDGNCDDRLFPRSKVYIASETIRTDVDAIYAAKGEPVGYLRRDQEEVWKPLAVSLNRQRHGQYEMVRGSKVRDSRESGADAVHVCFNDRPSGGLKVVIRSWVKLPKSAVPGRGLADNGVVDYARR
jgi:hypothetical protein